MQQSKDTECQIGLKKSLQYAVYKKHTLGLRTHRLKVRGWKHIFNANRNDKKAGIAILISGKIDFKTKAVKKDTIQ